MKSKKLFRTILIALLIVGTTLAMAFALSGCVDTPDTEDPINVEGIIINQVYGTGASASNENTTAGSHSFIELYNPTDEDVSLNGWSIQYAREARMWEKLDLTGTIKSKHSFLILGALTSSTGDELNLVFTSSDADQSWNIKLHHKGLKVCLMKSTTLITAANPFNTDGHGTKVNGYADMIGVAGNDEGNTIDGCEKAYAGIQSKQKGIRRINLTDTDNNSTDFEAIDYRLSKMVAADLARYRPKNTAFGSWQ